MELLTEITCTIRLLTGEPIVFKIEADSKMLRNAASRIENSMNSNYVGVELNEKLIIIPTNNIQTIEFSPTPSGLLSHAIKGAKPSP